MIITRSLGNIGILGKMLVSALTHPQEGQGSVSVAEHYHGSIVISLQILYFRKLSVLPKTEHSLFANSNDVLC